MQNEPTQAAIDLCIALGIPDHHAPTIQAAFAEREARLVGALESANTLLTKAVGDIVAYRIMACKRHDPSATAEYVEAINAIDATLAALKDRTHG